MAKQATEKSRKWFIPSPVILWGEEEEDMKTT
jgi:hypothetical protein